MRKVKNKNKKFSGQFKESLEYLKESRNYIIAVMLIFLGGILLGFIFPGQLGFLDEILKGIIDKIKGLGTLETILFILQNNLRASFYGMVFGVLLGIFPVIGSLSNGVILGYVMQKVWVDSGVREFWRILPHGVFELPAIFISLALGLRLGMFIFAKNKSDGFLERARKSMILFVCVVIPLLIIAALIEGLLIAYYK